MPKTKVGYRYSKKDQARGRERLLRLADLMDSLPPKELEMANEGWGQNPDRRNNECGTVACAAGHACISPKFRGLTWEPCRNDDGIDTGLVPVRHTPDGQIRRSWNAVMDYFALTHGQAAHLFEEECYLCDSERDKEYDDPVTPDEVSGRIRHFVANELENY